MKKLFFSLVILFSIAIQSQDLSDRLRGTWSSSATSYYVVILYNDITGYEFINFSFEENKFLKETVVEKSNNYVKTKLTNPNNNYNVFITYKFKDNKLYCYFEGDINKTTIYNKYWLITN